MMGVNKAIILGRLGRDAELSATTGGTPTASFSVATGHRYKEKDTTTWHLVKWYGKGPEAVGHRLTKGTVVYIEGRIDNRSYEKDGVTKYVSEIIADHVELMGDKPVGSVKQTETSVGW